ncbi:MAG: hypothetical protein ACOC1F_04720 [Myxococcota bacterium]
MPELSNRARVAVMIVTLLLVGACERETETTDRPLAPPGLPDPVEQPSRTSGVSEAEIALFARIEARRASLEKELEEKAKNGAPKPQLTRLRAEQQKELEQMLRESQLGEVRYDQIAQLVLHDPVLRQRVRTAIEASRDDPRPQ